MHLIVFIFISITLPEIKTKEMDYIFVEIISEEIQETALNEEIKEVKEVKEVKKLEEIKQIKINPSPPVKKPIIKPQINDTVEIIKKIDIKPKAPVEKPKIKIKKEIVKQEINPEKIINSDDLFDDMLKNLAENQPKPIKPIQEVKTETKSITVRTNKEKKIITNSIVNTILQQIKANYTIPPAQDLIVKKMVVQLRIYIRQDGTIWKTIVKAESLKRAKSDTTYLPYVEAAQRAIKKVGKLKRLPQKEYDLWDIVDINFTPFKT